VQVGKQQLTWALATGIAWRGHAHQASYHSRYPSARRGRIACGWLGNFCGGRACAQYPRGCRLHDGDPFSQLIHLAHD